MKVLYDSKINCFGHVGVCSRVGCPSHVTLTLVMLADTEIATSGHFDCYLKYPCCERKEELACSAVCVELFIFVSDLLDINFPTQKATSLVSLMEDIWNNTKSCG